MKAILIEEGKPRIVEGEERYFTDFVQKYLGTDIIVERVHLSSNQTLFMAVDEDGLCKQLPLNFFMETNNHFFPIQPIVGKAIVVRVKEIDYSKGSLYDFEVTDVTDEDIKKVDSFLDEDYLIELAMKFNKRNMY